MKPLGAKWMVQLHDYLQSRPEIAVNEFKGSGIVDCLLKYYIAIAIVIPIFTNTK